MSAELNKPAPTPVHGAALRAVLGLVDVNTVTNVETFQTFSKRIEEVQAWAARQPDCGVTMAYHWACSTLMSSARERLAVFQNSAKVLKAFEEIPKPDIGSKS